MDERALIARLQSANADELAKMISRPGAREERVFRAHLGEDTFERMHALAIRSQIARAVPVRRGNVVVIHGIMGGELTSFDRGGDGDHVWLSVPRLLLGALDRLELDASGLRELLTEFDVRATGIMKRSYGELLLQLNRNWNVRAFWFDWRKDLRLAAEALDAQISAWFGLDAPVHIVAHSMGGLVARAFTRLRRERWAAMWDKDGKGALGGRLVMLGTPNHGSFSIVQVITGLEKNVRRLDLIDMRKDLRTVLRIVNSFPGSLQMLPSPLVLPRMEALYKSDTYGDLNISQRHLDLALRYHREFHEVLTPERLIYVAGFNRRTLCDVDPSRLRQADAYTETALGDGRVPHALGLLEGVDAYYVEETHGDLPANSQILSALDELLTTGTTRALPDRVPAGVRGLDPSKAPLPAGLDDESDREFAALVERMRSRAIVTPDAAATVSAAGPDGRVGVQERKLEQAVTAGFLTSDGDRRPETEEGRDFPIPKIEIAVVLAPVETAHESAPSPAVDAVSVGHYIGIRPVAAEEAIDRALTAAIRGGEPGKLAREDLILTQFTDRGVLSGELGQPFILPDPRSPKRVIAIAGMGVPGRFGAPELTVLVRELCWSLGRLQKRHLATVLIGSGAGNLSSVDAMTAWMRGVKHALSGVDESRQESLRKITFAELSPGKALEIDEAVVAVTAGLRGQIEISYEPFAAALKQQLKAEIKRRAAAPRREQPRSGPVEPQPTRMTVTMASNAYRFGAVTQDAAVPEREIAIDPTIILSANDELAAEWNPARLIERGQFLEKLLIPDDLHRYLFTDAPLVLMLDSTTARIHWELMAQGEAKPGGQPVLDLERAFLGTSRGLTRQLRTTFAPPPEPPPPSRRTLRVLIVADPAEDQPLPGAQEEGAEVADLFESYDSAAAKFGANRVEVVKLIGPRRATRTNVLRELMMRSYDVLHYAGHCFYNEQNPSASGWLFSGNERLTAAELRRIDRIPKFVFSNACESGKTPDRSEERDDRMAPSFAEAFFERGVSNFVCTAWPVDDMAARQFACKLYAGLLGMKAEGPDDLGPWRIDPDKGPDPQPIHIAARDARLAIARATAKTGAGFRTWGAYQHYGNPYYRFFPSLRKSEEPPQDRPSARQPRPRSRKPSRKSKRA